jgi:putative transport protein
VTGVGARLAGVDVAAAAGLFAGSLTNTPALAAAVELLQASMSAAGESVLSRPVVAYSVAYPLGVLIPILAIALVPRLFRTAHDDDVRVSHKWPAAGKGRAGSGSLVVGTIEVTRADAGGATISTLKREANARVQTGRIRRAAGPVVIASDDEILQVGDLVTAVGESEDVEHFVTRLGVRSSEAINLDRRELDVRRIFVSNGAVAGHSLRELDLTQQFGAIVTAIRRGDADWVPTGDTVLQLGDRVRVLTRREALPAVSKFLGDSYRAVSEFDVLTFSFGIVLGIAVGMIPIPLPGDITLRLGLAGGPLVTAMLLGARGRTGPLVWGIPFGVSLTIREIGLLLFFAGIGTRSGFALRDALQEPSTIAMVGVGALSTLAAAATVLLAGHYLFRVPAGLLTGMIAGVHTQPAALSVALEQRLDDTPNVGYAAVFPVATVLKLIIAQVIARG